MRASIALIAALLLGCQPPAPAPSGDSSAPGAAPPGDAGTAEGLSPLERAIAEATGEVLVDPAGTLPRIEPGAEPRLVLPPDYAVALSAHDPHFQPWNTRGFPAWLLGSSILAPSQHGAPFAVVGDFDGNDRGDVAIMGRGSDYLGLVVLLAGEDGIRVHELQRRALPPVEEVYRGGFGEAIRYVAPGTFESEYEEGLELHTDAFEWMFLEKASEIIYWRDGRFHQWAATD